MIVKQIRQIDNRLQIFKISQNLNKSNLNKQTIDDVFEISDGQCYEKTLCAINYLNKNLNFQELSWDLPESGLPENERKQSDPRRYITRVLQSITKWKKSFFSPFLLVHIKENKNSYEVCGSSNNQRALSLFKQPNFVLQNFWSAPFFSKNLTVIVKL